jgi:transglutaminase-like putative cysteine protease
MTILAVRHITTYQYKQPVSFGEHWMMLRPRESLDQRVLDSKLEISPKPTDLRWTQDVFGNHVAVARFVGRAQALCFESTVRLDHFPTDIVDMEIENFTRCRSRKFHPARIRAMRQNQRIIRRDARIPSAAWEFCRQPFQVAAPP